MSAVVVTVKDDNLNLLMDAHVTIASDNGMATVVASGVTGAAGTYTVALDDGTYYVWLTKAGYEVPGDVMPYTLTVSGSTTATYDDLYGYDSYGEVSIVNRALALLGGGTDEQYLSDMIAGNPGSTSWWAVLLYPAATRHVFLQVEPRYTYGEPGAEPSTYDTAIDWEFQYAKPSDMIEGGFRGIVMRDRAGEDEEIIIPHFETSRYICTDMEAVEDADGHWNWHYKYIAHERDVTKWSEFIQEAVACVLASKIARAVSTFTMAARESLVSAANDAIRLAMQECGASLYESPPETSVLDSI